jgi:nitrogen-specific signal transduction histidine kinase/CheY-like chemotaxis protein
MVRDQLQRQERLAAVGQLAAGIAHDFNNIMAVIVLHAQLVSAASALSPRDRERLNTINTQARHATRLIEQILDFSRRSVLARQPLDLHPLLSEQSKLLRRTLPENIEVTFSAGGTASRDGMTYLVDADPTRLQQLVMNLAINARDAMPKGGELTLTLSSLTLEDAGVPPVPHLPPGQWVILEISDTGTGISPEVLDHMFEPFYTTKPAGQGTGLGLAQVHGIVGQHGGQIKVDTEVGQGTTFTIYLPALSTERVDVTDNAFGIAPEGRGETILMVEDSAALREALQEMLEGWRYHVLSAENGKAAIALLEELDGDVDLIVSDVVMPQMGGQALVSELRARGWQMPVILMSGHPQDIGIEALRAVGVHAWLPKPPDLAQLSTTIAAALA